MFGDALDAHYAFDVAKLEPGDILLSRIPMNLHDNTTWDSHLIQSLTRSRFSFVALHIANGLCIEAVGSGVARLPLSKVGVGDARNVCLLRARKTNEWAGRRAAAAGLRYLQRGFYCVGMPYTKCSALQDVQRAAAVNASLVASAYVDADVTLVEKKVAEPIFPGDFLQSALLEDVTDATLQRLTPQQKVTFQLDDSGLQQRVHHWEIATQLKVLCNYEVRRVLSTQTCKPSSMREMEIQIAEHRWAALDEAVYRGLEWYRYADVYQLKQQQFFGDAMTRSNLDRLVPPALCEERLLAALAALEAELQLLDIERSHWLQQRDYYSELLGRYDGKSFAYRHTIYNKQIAAGDRLVQWKLQQQQLYQNEARRRGLRLKIA